MPRFKQGHGRTGKNARKATKEATEDELKSQPDEQLARSHKQNPTPHKKLLAEKQARVAAWLSSEAGQEVSKNPKGQDLCGCELGLMTRKYEHDLFCPIFACFAFEVDCCAWDITELRYHRRQSLCETVCYPMFPCGCMEARHARRRPAFWDCPADSAVCMAMGSPCANIPRFHHGGPAAIGTPGLVIGRGNIPDFVQS
jgi:hypothetical protein